MLAVAARHRSAPPPPAAAALMPARPLPAFAFRASFHVFRSHSPSSVFPPSILVPAGSPPSHPVQPPAHTPVQSAPTPAHHGPGNARKPWNSRSNLGSFGKNALHPPARPSVPAPRRRVQTPRESLPPPTPRRRSARSMPPKQKHHNPTNKTSSQSSYSCMPASRTTLRTPLLPAGPSDPALPPSILHPRTRTTPTAQKVRRL
jgi:hypothetical protein